MPFPALVSQHPESARVVRMLRQDHDMISMLLSRFDVGVKSAESPTTIAQHLEGIAAIMESHFRFEERELEPLLDGLELHAQPGDVLGPM